jgi:hypothetical protein
MTSPLTILKLGCAIVRLAGVLKMAVTICPAFNACSTNCLPIPPFAPITAMFKVGRSVVGSILLVYVNTYSSVQDKDFSRFQIVNIIVLFLIEFEDT